MAVERFWISVLFMAGILLVAVCPAPAEFTFVRGDFNADSSLDIADAVGILVHLFQDPAGPECLDAGDLDDNGTVDISDAIRLLGFLFLGGRAPPPPFPDCGGDPTLDWLDCAASSSCPPGRHEIVRIRTVNAGVEVDLFSTSPFPARALPAVLCIGEVSSFHSRFGSDGGLNTIIFLVPAADFARARDGDPVTVQHGGCSPNLDGQVPFWDLWVFGPLDKSLLDR